MVDMAALVKPPSKRQLAPLETVWVPPSQVQVTVSPGAIVRLAGVKVKLGLTVTA